MHIICAATISIRVFDLIIIVLPHTMLLNTNCSIAHKLRFSPFKIPTKQSETMRFAFVKETKVNPRVLSLSHSNHPNGEEDWIR